MKTKCIYRDFDGFEKHLYKNPVENFDNGGGDTNMERRFSTNYGVEYHASEARDQLDIMITDIVRDSQQDMLKDNKEYTDQLLAFISNYLQKNKDDQLTADGIPAALVSLSNYFHTSTEANRVSMERLTGVSAENYESDGLMTHFDVDAPGTIASVGGAEQVIMVLSKAFGNDYVVDYLLGLYKAIDRYNRSANDLSRVKKGIIEKENVRLDSIVGQIDQRKKNPTMVKMNELMKKLAQEGKEVGRYWLDDMPKNVGADIYPILQQYSNATYFVDANIGDGGSVIIMHKSGAIACYPYSDNHVEDLGIVLNYIKELGGANKLLMTLAMYDQFSSKDQGRMLGKMSPVYAHQEGEGVRPQSYEVMVDVDLK